MSFNFISWRIHAYNAIGRAADAPAIRRLFANSPRDPRYHMLEHLSSKFRADPVQREPRAALILNRFTRTLTVMYATEAIEGILGVSAEQFKDKSFYECIQENCLPDAIRCLESAKANDSIAYLRFWHRDPRRAEDFDEEMREASASSDSEDGGVRLHDPMDVATSPTAQANVEGSFPVQSGEATVGTLDTSPQLAPANLRTWSGGSSTDLEHDSADAMFDRVQGSRSSTTSLVTSPNNRRRTRPAGRATTSPPAEPFEIEAVVSCTSDGLVVVMRHARPLQPAAQFPERAPLPMYARGLFAAPWGANAIRPHQHQPDIHNKLHHGFGAPLAPAGGPPVDDFMNSIREVAVFAWSLTGINGNIASYGHGVPRGEAQPPTLPVWDPYAQPVPDFLPPINQAQERWMRLDDRSKEPRRKNLYQHAGEEAVLRGRNTRPGSSSHRCLGSLSGYVYQGPGNYQNNQYDNLFRPVQGQQGFGAPSAEKAPPTQLQESAQGPTEGSRAIRSLWY